MFRFVVSNSTCKRPACDCRHMTTYLSELPQGISQLLRHKWLLNTHDMDYQYLIYLR